MKSIEDYLICDKCGHDMHEGLGEDFLNEARFGIENQGTWYVDVGCPHCNTKRRAYVDFTYEVFYFEFEDEEIY